MLQQYSKFWLNAKVKLALTSLITVSSVSQVQGPVADITLSSPVTTAQQVEATHSITLNPGFSANGANGTFKTQIVSPPAEPVTPAVIMDAVPDQNQNFVVTYTPVSVYPTFPNYPLQLT